MECVKITMSIKEKASQVFKALTHSISYEFRKKDPVGYYALLNIINSTEVDLQTYENALPMLNASEDSIWIRIDQMFNGSKKEFEDVFELNVNQFDDLETQVYDLVDYIESTPYLSDKEVEIFWEGRKIYTLSEKKHLNKKQL